MIRPLLMIVGDTIVGVPDKAAGSATRPKVNNECIGWGFLQGLNESLRNDNAAITHKDWEALQGRVDNHRGTAGMFLIIMNRIPLAP